MCETGDEAVPVMVERESYYQVLEKRQRGSLDITEWLIWFLGLYARAINNSKEVVEKALLIAKFWQTHRQTELNERQLKAVNKLLEVSNEFEGGLTNRKYVSLN